MKRARVWAGWLLLLVLLAAMLLWLLPQRSWSTSLTAAFPTDGALWQAELMDSHQANRQIRLVLTGLAEQELMAAALQLQQAMSAAGADKLQWQTPDQLYADFKRYGARAAGLLASASALQQLEQQQYQSLVDAAWQRLLSPQPLPDEVLARDPLLLSQQYLEAQFSQLQQNTVLQPAGLWYRGQYQGQTFLLLHGALTVDPFDSGLAEPIELALEQQISILQVRWPQLQIIRSGVLFHASQAAIQARHEMTLYGGLSAAGIIALLLLVFRSVQPLLLTLVLLSFAVLTGTVALLWCFQKPHVLAFVFATTLIGVAVDYSFHGLLAVRKGAAFFRQMLSGLRLSLLSTILGYAALLLLPLAILQQVAVFMISGLLAAYLAVRWFWQPLVNPCHQPAPLAMAAATGYLNWWQRVSAHFGWTLLTALPLLLIAGSFPLLQFNDDVRSFNASPPALVAQERLMQQYSGQLLSQRYLLVQASDTEQLLQREQQLGRLLDQWQQQGVLSGWQGLSGWLQPTTQQQELQRQLARAWQAPLVQDYLHQLGLTPPQQAPTPLVMSELPLLLQQNWFRPAAVSSAPAEVSIVQLHDWQSTSQQLQALQSFDFVTLYDPVVDASARIRGVRLHLEQGLLLACGLMLLVLGGLFGSRKSGAIALYLLLASVCSVLPTLLMGQALTLFHLVGLLLVIALSMDYAVFFSSALEKQDVQLAVGLSALTSLLAFGMLAFSANPVISDFGQTVLYGVGAAVLFAPVLSRLALRER